MIVGLIGAVVIGCAMGWAAERFKFTRIGLVPAISTAIGGAIVAYLILLFFGVGIYGRGVTSAVGAAVALFFAPRMRR
ncbi:MAG: hypothetical protein AAF409_03840 [Pseudomonadota bacterium]